MRLLTKRRVLHDPLFCININTMGIYPMHSLTHNNVLVKLMALNANHVGRAPQMLLTWGPISYIADIN